MGKTQLVVDGFPNLYPVPASEGGARMHTPRDFPTARSGIGIKVRS